MQYITLAEAAAYAENKMREQFVKHHIDTKMAFPKIEWKSLGKNRAGFATYRTNTITLNSDYLTSPSYKEFLNETPLHELAHIVAGKLGRSTGHDKVWRNVCYAFGLKGNRCHSFETPENAKQRKARKPAQVHTVYCPCMEHKIGHTRYKRMVAGEVYLCTVCKQKLTFTKAA